MGRMTKEQAIINLEKELRCRKEEIPECENVLRCDCPVYVPHEDLTNTLQALYDWLRAERRTDD